MIIELRHNQVFVYGSNLNGFNGGGAAMQAEESFGAIHGIGVGRAGQSYAIPTLDGNLKKLPLEVIKHYLAEFAEYASLHQETEFLLTKCGEGIAGFSHEEMESIMPKFPSNVIRI